MFAIIDVETTGGSPDRDKITDICILIHDGLSVVDKFSSLINPERYIPNSITRLTGITNEMVKDAPKFYEVAKKIVEITDGMIFVAHNVNFDYGFVRNEFKSLGYDYKREKLCTIKLSRKLLPKRPSYSLGRLCESLGITNESRHRAEGDAEATAQLFDILLAKKNQHSIFQKQDIDEIGQTRLDSFRKHLVSKLPEETGIYYFLDKSNQILYVGKSKNIKTRAFSHLTDKRKKEQRLCTQVFDIDFEITGSELIALLMEAAEIKKHKPEFNQMRQRTEYNYAIAHTRNESGFIQIKIVKAEEMKNDPLQYFGGYVAAREKLNLLIDKYILCPSHCGLYDGEGACFNHQIKLCNGACAGVEETETYNYRAAEALSEMCMPHDRFIIMEQGRGPLEKAIVLIENGRFAGYGYFDESDSVGSPEELKSFIKRMDPFPDADDIIKQYVRAKPKVKKIIF